MRLLRVSALAAAVSLCWTTSGFGFVLANLNYDWRDSEQYHVSRLPEWGGSLPSEGVSNDVLAGAYDFGALSAGGTIDTLTHAPTVWEDFVFYEPDDHDPEQAIYDVPFGSDLVSLSHYDTTVLWGSWTVHVYEHSEHGEHSGRDQDWYTMTPSAGRLVEVSLLAHQPTASDGVTPIGTGLTVESDWTLGLVDGTGLRFVERSGVGTLSFVSDGDPFFIHVYDPTPEAPDHSTEEHRFYRLLIEDAGPADGAVPAPGAAVGMLGLLGVAGVVAAARRLRKPSCK